MVFKSKKQIYYIRLYQLKLIQQFFNSTLKKGKKSIMEKNFKKMLFFMAKNNKIFKQNSWIIIFKSIFNITPEINIKAYKVKRRVFHQIKFMTFKKQNYLICMWLIKGTAKYDKKNFYKNLAYSFKDVYFKKGEAFKHFNEFNKVIKKHIR
ncbi:MAG: hypothetical protein CMP47_00175 [Rickettsiales bacterium]|nr:hypothetical protein [Rickettsiales bacterium]